MQQQTPNTNAFFKVMATIASCYTTPQLNVAERLLLSYKQQYELPADDGRIETLYWLLNSKKNYFIS